MSASCEPLVFQTTQRCHSVFSCRCPLWSFQVRLVAREKVATRLPPVVDRTSGSFPRFPIRVTLFKLRLTDSSWRERVHILAAHVMIQSVMVHNQFVAQHRLTLQPSSSTSHIHLFQRTP